MSKATKHRITFLTPFVLLAVGYLCFTLISSGIQLYQLHYERSYLKKELKSLRGDGENLKTEITKLQDKDYVARYARENYLYTKDGEYVIKVDTHKKKEVKKDYKISDDYIIYGGVFFEFFIIIYIFRKSRKRKERR